MTPTCPPELAAQLGDTPRLRWWRSVAGRIVRKRGSDEPSLLEVGGLVGDHIELRMVYLQQESPREWEGRPRVAGEVVALVTREEFQSEFYAVHKVLGEEAEKKGRKK